MLCQTNIGGGGDLPAFIKPTIIVAVDENYDNYGKLYTIFVFYFV